MFINIVPEKNDNFTVVISFMSTWFIYGILAFIEDGKPWKVIGYNLLDLINKAIFGIYIANTAYLT